MQRALLARGAAFVVLLALLLALYFESWRSMQQVWNIPTYTHGYVIPAIAAWLAWRQRHALAGLQAGTGWLALAGIAGCGLLWLAGDLAGVNAARHFAIMGMAVLLVPLLFGWPIARRLLFPLGFLFFAVPFGEFLLPVMMEATAAVTIWLVGLCGVPIYREGLSFILPSGSWEVVEECSGQRYLIAALPLAALYAWLSFRRNRTRWLFVLFAMMVALLANWLRAWGIVMLGHLSDMRIATGVDHLIYGWGFFGVVMFLLFWLGSRWTEAPLPGSAAAGRVPHDIDGTDGGPAARNAGASRSISRVATTSIAGALVIAAWVGVSGHLQSRDSPALNLVSVTGRLSGFEVSGVEGGSGAAGVYAPGYGGARQALRLRSTQTDAFAWIGAYEHQGDAEEMIQHANSVRPRSMSEWRIVEQQAFAPSATRSPVAEYLLESQGERILVWRSYVVDGRSTASDSRAKLLTAWRVARGAGDRSMVLVLWTALGDGAASRTKAAARSRLEQALEGIVPELARADRGAS